jgi:hypothetical protein
LALACLAYLLIAYRSEATFGVVWLFLRPSEICVFLVFLSLKYTELRFWCPKSEKIGMLSQCFVMLQECYEATSTPVSQLGFTFWTPEAQFGVTILGFERLGETSYHPAFSWRMRKSEGVVRAPIHLVTTSLSHHFFL